MFTQSLSGRASSGVQSSMVSLRGEAVVAVRQAGCPGGAGRVMRAVCKQEFIGKVVGSKADKTAKVEVLK